MTCRKKNTFLIYFFYLFIYFLHSACYVCFIILKERYRVYITTDADGNLVGSIDGKGSHVKSSIQQFSEVNYMKAISGTFLIIF